MIINEIRGISDVIPIQASTSFPLGKIFELMKHATPI
jgi:hypothetical protein